MQESQVKPIAVMPNNNPAKSKKKKSVLAVVEWDAINWDKEQRCWPASLKLTPQDTIKCQTECNNTERTSIHQKKSVSKDILAKQFRTQQQTNKQGKSAMSSISILPGRFGSSQKGKSKQGGGFASNWHTYIETANLKYDEGKGHLTHCHAKANNVNIHHF